MVAIENIALAFFPQSSCPFPFSSNMIINKSLAALFFCLFTVHQLQQMALHMCCFYFIYFVLCCTYYARAIYQLFEYDQGGSVRRRSADALELNVSNFRKTIH